LTAAGRRPPLPPGPWLVVGLVRSGVAAARALRARGEDVVVVDVRDTPGAAELRAEGFAVHAPADGVAQLGGVRAVCKSPGVPRRAPVIAAALERGVPVLGELEVGWRLLDNEAIVVTGTNGKTTTTEWLGHLHRVAGRPVAVAGNVGTALTGLAGTFAPDVTVVLEASSYQLQDADALAPECAVLLNITPDHLDRHGTLEAYRAAKLRVFAHQGNDDLAVAPDDLEGVDDLGGCARRVCFGTRPDSDVVDRAGALWWAGELLVRHDALALPGAHNRRNAMAAAAAALARGLDRDAVREGLRTFGGVEHRLEDAGTVAGVRYVNDSKATNVDSTLVALAAQDAPVHLILGGQGKGQDFAPLREPVAVHARSVHLIGEAAPVIERALRGAGVPVEDDGDLAAAVAAARVRARPGEVVLLSPACASYDQFAVKEDRGRAFKELMAGG